MNLQYKLAVYLLSSKNNSGFPEAADVTARLRGSRIHYRAGFTRHRLLRPRLYRR